LCRDDTILPQQNTKNENKQQKSKNEVFCKKNDFLAESSTVTIAPATHWCCSSFEFRVSKHLAYLHRKAELLTMTTLQSESSINFVNSLARRIADRALSSDGKNKKSTPSSKKLIEKSLLQINDSQLKETLESNVKYFEKLLDLTIAQYINDANEDFTECTTSRSNFLCLNAPRLHFKDTLSLSKTTLHATVDALVTSIHHTFQCTPQQVASTLVSMPELPAAASCRLMHVLRSRLALHSRQWCESSPAWDSSAFLLAFVTSHACRSSTALATDPCWAAATTLFQDASCFTFVGNISYWMLKFAAKQITISAENVAILCSHVLELMTVARKHSEHLVVDADDHGAPVACLLTHCWLQSIPDSSDKKMILREILTFMRQWEGGDKLGSLWEMLVSACGVDAEVESELIAAGVSKCSGRYVKFSEWFITQDDLVTGAMHSVEVSVSGNRIVGQDVEEDMDDADEIEMVLDGKAHTAESGGEDEGEDEGRVEFIEDASIKISDKDADEELPVTFFLDKQGDSLVDESVASESSSQILADLGDLGKKSAKKSKKRKSLAIVEEETEADVATNEKSAKPKKTKVKKAAAATAAAAPSEEVVGEKRSTRTTRAARSSSQ
jgi:hypothetical protein